eukprot:TRINITY_DN8351_c0_g1_i1.p1 TRINITY_DN8351_c0_g1~~TRINITY_DN8351_c0_g1_i1.p1  ORF type:complete len:310 (-),score=198.51 TRINITY_DN8351_c0_g1_i1:32-961(-)
MVERHDITQFYTAPTAIRAVQKYGNEFVTRHNRSTLRVLGTVGEPINPEAWRFYHDVIGERRCSIVDTFWQTESGAHMLTPLPGATPQKPGAATLPALGMQMSLVDAQSGAVLAGNGVTGVLVASRPWPSIARTVFNDHQRYLNTYMRAYPGHYFTGDGAARDADGYYWIGGRVDDVLSVAGHRLGTAEVEAALTSHPDVAEAAVVGVPHEVKGQAIFAYIILGDGIVDKGQEHVGELKSTVRRVIGPIATPETILVVPGLPKTRSGKIMRRLCRKVIESPDISLLGDVSTLADPSIIQILIDLIHHKK